MTSAKVGNGIDVYNMLAREDAVRKAMLEDEMTLPLDNGLPKPGQEGWSRPMASVRRHYIVNGDSLCGAWVNVPGPYDQDLTLFEQYCSRCAYEAGKRHARSEMR